VARIAGVTPEETKAKLIDAAAMVFASKGYERATVAEIAREAGTTNGAIYTHYDRKADLLVDAMRVHLDRALEQIAPADWDNATSLLIALSTRLIDRDDSASTLLVEGLAAARRDPELAEVLAAALGERELFMTALLAEGQARGELTGDVQADAASRFMLMLSLGSMFVKSLGLEPIAPDAWENVIRRGMAAFVTGVEQ
jgi:AcrR family transcriptional regulator